MLSVRRVMDARGRAQEKRTSFSQTPSRVCIRLCKHGVRYIFLTWSTLFNQSERALHRDYVINADLADIETMRVQKSSNPTVRM